MENKTIPTVGVLILKDNKVLLICHKELAEHMSGKYGLPAGRIENNEEEKIAALRELKEETGLISAKDKLMELPYKWEATIEGKNGKRNLSMVVFVCDDFVGTLDEDLETKPLWVNIKNLKDYDLLINVEDIVHKGLDFISKN